MKPLAQYGSTGQYASSCAIQRFCYVGLPPYAHVMQERTRLGFGARLKEARENAKMSGAKLGVGLGETPGKDASRQTISDWESERHYPSIRQLYLICLKLGTSADELLFGNKDPFTDERVVTAVKAIGQLGPKERADLLQLLAAPGVPDGEVEEKMPATRLPVKQ